MQLIRANTQVKVVIGPVVAVANGYVPVTTLALNTADEAEIMKHDAGSVTDISGATFAAITSADGYYNLTLTTSHTDTEGLLTVLINDDSLCLPVKQTFMVLAEAAYDSMFVAKDDGFMDVNIKTVGRADTQETEATNLEAACAAYSATRGLAGTALPAAAADAAGGLPISDAGGLDLDAKIGALTFTVAGDVDVNVQTWGGTAISTPPAVALGNVAHGGTSATLRLGGSTTTPPLYVTNSGGDAVQFEATGGNGKGFDIIGNGTGHGLHSTGGATGDGIRGTGGATSGDGMHLIAPTQGRGLHCILGGTGFSITAAMIEGDISGNISGNLSGSVGSVTGNVGGNVVGTVAQVTGSVGSINTNGITAASFAADVDAEILSYLVDDATRIDASALNTATVTTIPAILLDTAEIGAAGAGLTAIPWNASWDAEVQSEVDDALKATLAEGYRATGSVGSVRDMLYEIIGHLGESSISSTTKTVKKLDGSTTAKTYTLDDATTPTSITETT